MYVWHVLGRDSFINQILICRVNYEIRQNNHIDFIIGVVSMYYNNKNEFPKPRNE